MNLLKRKFIGILLVSFFLMLCVFINNTFASTIYNGTPSGSVLNIKIDYVLSDDEGNTKPDGSNTFITGESFNITFVGNISVDCDNMGKISVTYKYPIPPLPPPNSTRKASSEGATTTGLLILSATTEFFNVSFATSTNITGNVIISRFENNVSKSYSIPFSIPINIVAPFTLTYHANGGIGAPASESRLGGNTAALSPTIPTWPGHTFGGWNTSILGTGTTTYAGDFYTMPNSDTTLYANWALNTYTVTFDSQGGSPTPSPVSGITSGSTITLPSNPTWPGDIYTFGGWYTATGGGGTQFLSSTPVTANITVYANWTLTPILQPTVTLSVQAGFPTSVRSDIGTTSLDFYTTNANQCVLTSSPNNNDWNGTASGLTNGDHYRITGTTTSNTTYTATCSGVVGSTPATASTTIPVITTQDFPFPLTCQAFVVGSATSNGKVFVNKPMEWRVSGFEGENINKNYTMNYKLRPPAYESQNINNFSVNNSFPIGNTYFDVGRKYFSTTLVRVDGDGNTHTGTCTDASVMAVPYNGEIIEQ